MKPFKFKLEKFITKLTPCFFIHTDRHNNCFHFELYGSNLESGHQLQDFIIFCLGFNSFVIKIISLWGN